MVIVYDKRDDNYVLCYSSARYKYIVFILSISISIIIIFIYS